jgi:hypothetical protein
MSKNASITKKPVVTFIKISNSCRQWIVITIAASATIVSRTYVFAGVNLGIDFLQSNQKQLNIINVKSRAPSLALRPTNFVLTLPTIPHVDGETNLYRDLNLASFGIDLRRLDSG